MLCCFLVTCYMDMEWTVQDLKIFPLTKIPSTFSRLPLPLNASFTHTCTLLLTHTPHSDSHASTIPSSHTIIPSPLPKHTSHTDPKARRLGRLLASNVMELAEEKIPQLYIPPSSSFDQYLRTLRAQPPNYRQTGLGSCNEVTILGVIFMVSFYLFFTLFIDPCLLIKSHQQKNISSHFI
jgi:hypothetical protein